MFYHCQQLCYLLILMPSQKLEGWLRHHFNSTPEKHNRMKLNDEQNKSVFNGVIIGYLVLLLHVLLIIGLGITVVVVKGIYDFRWLIIIAGIALIGGSGYYFYHYFKVHKQKIHDMMSDPAFNDRTLEISLMGGMATIKLGHKDENLQLIQAYSETEIKQLESPKSNQINELTKLNQMLNDGLITREEFLHLKQKII